MQPVEKEKLRKRNLALYGGGIVASHFALYTFLFVLDRGVGWKIALMIIAAGWLISAVSRFV